MRYVRQAMLLLALAAIRAESAPVSLQEAYDAALLNDNPLQVALAERDAASEGVAIARAGLLPSVSANLSISRVRGERLFDQPGGAPQVSTPLDYEAPVAGLNLRMPLFNLDAWRRVGQARAQRDLAESVISSSRNEMLERLAGAYLQYRLAAESIDTALTRIEAAQVQAQWARQRFERGEAARNEQVTAEAQVELTQSQLRDAEDLADTARLMLQQMTGLDWPRPVAAAASSARSVEAAVSPLPDLLERVEEADPEIETRRRGVELARATLGRQRAGHYPRLDLVAGASNAQNESISTIDQEIRQRSVGLQLSMPLYSGGGVNAAVEQAAAYLRKAELELAAARQAMAIDVTRLHAAVQTGLAKTRALQQVADAATDTLTAARRGVRAGVSTESDVATALSSRASALQDFAQAFHDLQYARFRLWLRSSVNPQQAISDLESAIAAGDVAGDVAGQKVDPRAAGEGSTGDAAGHRGEVHAVVARDVDLQAVRIEAVAGEVDVAAGVEDAEPRPARGRALAGGDAEVGDRQPVRGREANEGRHVAGVAAGDRDLGDADRTHSPGGLAWGRLGAAVAGRNHDLQADGFAAVAADAEVTEAGAAGAGLEGQVAARGW